MASVIKRILRSSGVLAVLALTCLVLAALVLMSAATENSAEFGRLYSWLLLSTTIGLFLLTALIGRNLYRLLSRYRQRAPGARLTLRLVVLFIGIAIAPVSVVYYFSVQFLQRGIDSWFDVQVESALDDSLELSRAALDLRMREVLKLASRMAEQLIDVDGTLAAVRLSELRIDTDASELSLFSQSGRIIAAASADPMLIVPNRPSDVVLLQVRQGHDYVSLDPIRDTGFHIRAIVPVPGRAAPGSQVYLQALFPVSDRFSNLADSVRSAYASYQELLFLRNPLKKSFILALSLVMLLGCLAAIGAALYAARRLVEPISDLADGTRAVAAGELDTQLAQSGNDELGFLVHSFNQMTRKLAQARDTALRSQQLLERQRAYLEVVLARLSSGVLTLDHDGKLRTSNAAAAQILGVDLSARTGTAVTTIAAEHNYFHHFLDTVAPHVANRAGDWRQEITLFGQTGRQVLMCRGSSLPDAAGLEGGHVIVFDDVTTLVQVERDAAWAEVARRLAHEIKNPLTPIQLAAERIRHKYLKGMSVEDGRILERGTHTIVQQVQAMKEMVDAFNEYARPPQLRLKCLHLNDFIAEVMYLYRDYPQDVDIKIDLDPADPVIEADRGRLRQVLHNVVKNAIEAMKDRPNSELAIATRSAGEPGATHVELSFTDNGPGFPEGRIGDIFEPYVTTKHKGTGLGLAIVKKIVEEHGGLIHGDCPAAGGARIVIRIPTIPAIPEPAAAELAATSQSSTKEAG